VTRPEDAPDTIRLDKWLWQARALKTRALAQSTIESGRIRVNSVPVTKPGRVLRIGDVLTFTLGGRTCVWRVVDLGTRRGPASEAQGLYDDLTGGHDDT
jgi:ribosome-associated heat shock protein Hsp15